MENQITKSKKQIIVTTSFLFIILSIIKFIEFIFIRTEEHTILADNVICKICCIAGTDELQIIRIVLSNLLSLGIVLLINKKKNSKD